MQLKDVPGSHMLQASVAGNATAGTADEFTIGRAPFNAKVVAVYFVPVAAVTGAATHYMTVTVRNRVSGAGTAVVASKAYSNTVNAAAFDDNVLDLTATAADLLVAEGDLLTCEKLVTGNGMAMPDGHICVVLQAR